MTYSNTFKALLIALAVTVIFINESQAETKVERLERKFYTLASQMIQKAEAQNMSEEDRMTLAKALVLQSLRDPGSAIFRGIIIRPGIACGYVSAKNGFGGYGAALPFIVPGYEVAIMRQQVPADIIEGIWNRYCR